MTFPVLSARTARCLHAVAMLAALPFLIAGCDRPPVRPPDVLLITVDTLRADHLGIYGYPRETSPFLDRLFADGAVFERAYSTEANTPPSVMSILSGLPPRVHGIRGFYELADEDVQLLPDRLPEAYQSAAFVSNIVLTEEALGISDRFDHYDDFVDEPEANRPLVFERNAGRTTDAAVEWLESERDPARPLFLWVHYIDPHGPYRPPEDTPRRFEHTGSVGLPPRGKIPHAQRDPEITDVLDYIDRYDEEIAYADQEIERLFEVYGRSAELDEAFVLFTSDHGESMREHGIWFTHGYHVWNEIMHVPLMIRGPGVTTGRRRGLATGLDVVPTLLAAAGAAPLDATDDPLAKGYDLRREETPEDRVVYGEASLAQHRWRAGWRAGDKWIYSNLGDRIQPKLHFDLATDPEELDGRLWFANSPPKILTNLVASDPAHAKSGARPGKRLAGPKIDPRVSDLQRRQLEALGYGEADPAASD